MDRFDRRAMLKASAVVLLPLGYWTVKLHPPHPPHGHHATSTTTTTTSAGALFPAETLFPSPVLFPG